MFNYRLKEVRRNVNMDAQEFADKLGIAKSSVYAYERGTNKPSFELLEALLTKFNINSNWLFTGQGDIFNSSRNSLEIKYEPLKLDKTAFGKRLTKIRVTHNMVTSEIAPILDIKESKFLDIENGKREPTIDEIIKICSNFEITADWLLFGKE